MKQKAHGLRSRLVSDPPWPNECKLRIKSDGTPEGTAVYVVDSDGRELMLGGVVSVAWKLSVPWMASVELRVEGDVEADIRFTPAPTEPVAP